MVPGKKLKISMVGMSPALIRRQRLKGIPLAPMTLKAYVDSHISKEFPGLVKMEVKTFFIEEIHPPEMATQIITEKPDVVAFSVYIWNYLEVMKCARIIKDMDKRIVIVCGGPQVSSDAKEVMTEHPYIDVVPYIVIPGEVIFYHLVKALLEKKELNTVEGIVYRVGDSLFKTAPPTEELDYSLAPSPYLNDNISLVSGDAYTVVLETSRGCPYDCGYCFYARDTGKIRCFPLEKVLKEIETVYNTPDIKHVMFADSDLLLKRERAKIIIKHILGQDSSADSEFDTNLLHMTEDIAKLLMKIPGFRFCFAVQTTNPRAKKYIGRLRPDADVFAAKIKMFKRWAPNAHYNIDVMLGLPGDDLCGFKKTLDTCLSFEPTRIALNYPVYLLPGTRFLEQKETLGIRHSLTPPYCIVETKTFPRQDMEKAVRLTLWLEMLTYRYFAIARFFFAVCAGGTEGMWIGTLEKWIAAIEKKLDIFGTDLNIVDTATKSVQEWNRLKGVLLRKFSETESAYQIYHTIQQLEKKTDFMEKTITLGVRIFDYMRSQKMDSVEFTHFEQLPDSITKDCHTDEIIDVFSGYKR